jgi:hypothetical protein
MSVLLGHDTYLKIAPEAAWGDGATPSISVPIVSENLQPKVEMKNRASELRGDRFSAPPLAGRQYTDGGVVMNAYPDIIGYFLLTMFGTPTVSNPSSGVYDNVFEPGISVDNSLSLELSKAGANPLMIAGYMVNQLQWNQGVSAEAQMLRLGIAGGGKFATEGSPSAWTAPTTSPFQFDEAVMTAAGSTVYLDSIQWTDNNGLVIPNHKISAGAETRQPVLANRFAHQGQFVLDFADLTDWDKFRQATNVAITATYTTTQAISGAYYYTLTMTLPAVKYRYPLPDIGSPDIAKATIPYDAFPGTVGGSTVPVSYTLRCGTDFSAV